MNAPDTNQPPPAQKEKKKGGVLKGVAIGCGILILIILGFFTIGGYLVYRGFSTDPAKAESVAQEILAHETPAGFKGEFSMSMMGIKMAAITSGPGADDHLMFLAIPGGKASQDDLQRQMRQAMKKRGEDREVVEDRGHEKFKVRGKEMEAQVQLTAGKGGNGRLLQYILAVEGKAGDPVLLLILGNEKRLDHDWVQRFLDTVK